MENLTGTPIHIFLEYDNIMISWENLYYYFTFPNVQGIVMVEEIKLYNFPQYTYICIWKYVHFHSEAV